MNDTKEITKPNPIGRPTVITDETVRKLDSILKMGGTIEEACSYAEIGRQTYYDNLERDESFRTKMDSAQHYADIAAKNVVVNSIIKDKDLNSAKWWLEKREFKNTGNTTNVQVNTFSSILEDERKEFGI